MGQQQMLFIILGAIIVGIAIAVGITIFGSASVSSNKDALVNELNNLATDAYQFRVRPSTLGGGGQSYAGYVVPGKLDTTDDGTFTPITPVSTPNAINFVATSVYGFGTISVTLDKDGKLGSFTYSGDFQ